MVRHGGAVLTSSTPVPRTEYVSCSGPECEKAAQRQGYCWGHMRQKQRGERLSVLEKRKQRDEERLFSAIEAYNDVDTDDDQAWERARRRVLKAARDYSRHKFCTMKACAKRPYMHGLCHPHYWAWFQKRSRVLKEQLGLPF